MVGLKVRRDFNVYRAAFASRGFSAMHLPTPLLLRSEPGSGLHYGPVAAPRRLESVAAVLCHSVLASHCFKGYPDAAGGAEAASLRSGNAHSCTPARLDTTFPP